jgi:hypothetical protein
MEIAMTRLLVRSALAVALALACRSALPAAAADVNGVTERVSLSWTVDNAPASVALSMLGS